MVDTFDKFNVKRRGAVGYIEQGDIDPADVIIRARYLFMEPGDRRYLSSEEFFQETSNFLVNGRANPEQYNKLFKNGVVLQKYMKKNFLGFIKYIFMTMNVVKFRYFNKFETCKKTIKLKGVPFIRYGFRFDDTTHIFDVRTDAPEYMHEEIKQIVEGIRYVEKDQSVITKSFCIYIKDEVDIQLMNITS